MIWSNWAEKKIYDLHQTKLACSMGRVPLLVKMRGITCIRVPTWKCGIQCKINNVERSFLIYTILRILNIYNDQKVSIEYVLLEGMYWILTISEGASTDAGVVASAVALSPPRIPPITSPKSPRSYNLIDCRKCRKRFGSNDCCGLIVSCIINIKRA